MYPGTPTFQQAVELVTEDREEAQRLLAWEFRCLLDLGFTIEQGLELTRDPRFTWHDADDLIKRSVPLDLVVELLT